MAKFIAYIILRTLLIGISFALFMIFGGVCAFLWLSGQSENLADMSFDASDSFGVFLGEPEGTSQKFTYAELNGGVFLILKDKGKRIGNSTVIPAYPIIRPDGKNLNVLINVRLPYLPNQGTTTVSFLISPNAELKSIHIGGAIVPHIFIDLVLHKVLREYKHYGVYIDALKNIKSIDVSENSVELIK